MKKLLTILGAIVITSSATAVVVACGPKEEKNVKFIIPGNTTNKASHIYKSYKELADEFNKTSGSKIKIDVQWKEGDAISKAVASGEALPDLYIEYPDVVASNTLGRTKEKVRDMEESVGKLENGKQLKDLFVKEAFYEEGKINGKLALLPLTKSIDFTTVNMKLFVELIMMLERSEGTASKANDKKLSDTLMLAIDTFNKRRDVLLENMQYKVNQTATNHIVTMQERFESPNMKTRSIEETNSKSGYIFKKDAKVTSDLRTEFSNILTALNTNPSVDGIRSVMQKQENIELFTKLYSYLFNLKDGVSEDVTTNNGAAFVRDQMFSVGVDSMENKIFMQAALDSKNDTIDASNNPPSNFIYKLENFDPSTREGKFTINNSEDSSISKILNSFDKLASFAKNRKDNDPNNKWGGSFMPGRLGVTYSSSYFAQGTMLATSSSSAGTWAIPSKNALPQDLISTSTALVRDDKDTGEDYFLSRGPSVAGFKSTGKNASEKETLVTKFLNYSLQPKVQSKFALQSGYIPSTKAAIEKFSNYVNGNYDSYLGKWTPGVTLPSDHAEYEQVLEAITGENKPKTDVLVADLLKKYISIDPTDKSQESTKTHLVSNVANPFGQLIKNAISDSIKTYVVKSDVNKTFSSVLKNDKTSSETIIGQLKQNITGDLAKVELVMGPLNKAIDYKRIKQD